MNKSVLVRKSKLLTWKLSEVQESEANDFVLGIPPHADISLIGLVKTDIDSLKNDVWLSMMAFHTFISAVLKLKTVQIPTVIKVFQSDPAKTETLLFISSLFQPFDYDQSDPNEVQTLGPPAPPVFEQILQNDPNILNMRIVKTMNLLEVHWCFVVIDPTKRTVEIVDSLTDPGQTIMCARSKAIHSFLVWYLEMRDKYKLKDILPDPTQWHQVIRNDIPVQSDDTSCGVYAAYNLWYFCTTGDLPPSNSWNRSDISSMRRFMAFRILEKLKVEHSEKKARWQGVLDPERLRDAVHTKPSVAGGPLLYLPPLEFPHSLDDAPRVNAVFSPTKFILFSQIEDPIKRIHELIEETNFFGSFNYFTRVRGDGNCLYRAVAYAILRHFFSTKRQRDRVLQLLLSESPPCVTRYTRCFNNLANFLHSNSAANAMELINMIIKDHELDWALIFLLKQRVATYLLNTSADNGTRSLWAAAAKSHLKAESVSFGNKSIDSLSDQDILSAFVYKIVLIDKKYADELVISVLPSCINANVAVISLSEAQTSLHLTKYYVEPRGTSFLNILLLRIGNHYDVLHNSDQGWWRLLLFFLMGSILNKRLFFR